MTNPALPRKARVGVDLGALARNYRRLADIVAPSRILAVVKADAYGHGAVEVARTLEPLGAAGFGVATLAEGAELREAGIAAPVFALSPTPDDGLDALFHYRLTPIVSSLDGLRALSERANARAESIALHLKFDTGMTRLGLDLDEVGAALDLLRGNPGLRLEGLMSHLACAEQPDAGVNAGQRTLFTELFALDWPTVPGPRLRHLANSAAALHLPESRFDLVRLGLALYGYDSAARDGAGFGLEPVMSIEAEVVQRREIAPGRHVGYGGRFAAERPSEIAIVPLGYADGYSWRLGTRAEAIVHGRRVPVAGSVSMDLTALDVTGCAARAGDRVTLLGAQGGERITAFELAAHVGTVPYQMLCLFGLRLPRHFTGSTE